MDQYFSGTWISFFLTFTGANILQEKEIETKVKQLSEQFREKVLKYKEIFRDFYNDISPIISIVTLKEYDCVLDSSSKFGLDFDDSYQYSVAKENGLAIVTPFPV